MSQDDRLKLPPEKDFAFYQRRKHDKWREVPPPEAALEAPVADSHAHIHMLPDPAWELARCVANGVDFVCEICDPSEDGTRPYDEMDSWVTEAQRRLAEAREGDGWQSSLLEEFSPSRSFALAPDVRIAVGVHPHNARLYDDNMEELVARLAASKRTAAIGEIGLDFHYDLSPREVQREVFRRQIRLAKRLGLPIALHLRGGEDSVADDAHAEAFEILADEGFPERGTLLHCCALPPAQLAPWVEAGYYVAYGGALTFKNADAAREGARLVPLDRLLVETDSPYMTPEPMRGAACTPAHVIFTAARLAEVRGMTPGEERRGFLEQLHENAVRFLGSGTRE